MTTTAINKTHVPTDYRTLLLRKASNLNARLKNIPLVSSFTRNRSVPFLEKIPAEVRTLIWFHLLAGRIIRVKSKQQCAFNRTAWEQYELSREISSLEAVDTHPLFLAYIANEVPDWASKTESKKAVIRHSWRNSLFNHRSWSTGRHIEEPPVRDAPTTISLNLSILLTCREIYTEAHPIFWQQNTFSLETTGNEAAKFLRNRTREQKQLITSLQFISEHYWFNSRPNHDILASELPNLQELHFFVYIWSRHKTSVEYSPTAQEMYDTQISLFRWYSKFRPKRVGVIVSSEPSWRREGDYRMWRDGAFYTFEEALAFADVVRSQILSEPDAVGT